MQPLRMRLKKPLSALKKPSPNKDRKKPHKLSKAIASIKHYGFFYFNNEKIQEETAKS
jgi:hypothetical protein